MTDLFTIQWEPLTTWPLEPTKPRSLERVKLAKKHAHPDRQPQGDRTRWDALALALEALGLNT